LQQLLDKPLADITPEMAKHFTYGGRIKVQEWFFETEFRFPQITHHWSKQQVESNVKRIRRGELLVSRITMSCIVV
jgi:hypothetical protein